MAVTCTTPVQSPFSTRIALSIDNHLTVSYNHIAMINVLGTMPRVLPGTTIELDLASEGAAVQALNAIFLPGGLVLSQVCQLTGLDAHIIHNWIKRGFLSPPKSKKYSKDQFCRIALMNILKNALQFEKIARLLESVNNCSACDAEMIGDAQFYITFIALVGRMRNIDSFPQLDRLIEDLPFFEAPSLQDAAPQFQNALRVVAYAYLGTSFTNRAHTYCAILDI